ncbi:HetP family heterocyst commitment protein [Pantanalinema rosaneae CENA516]|uniref:HetP family heterocyst commitment protein n=1 Tax=Pantanalinema rosaneae TaxID=1620701 RepID=UPI003D6FD0BD
MVHQGVNSRDPRSRLDRVMEPEQFNQVIEAILAGKYSWACVLILQFGGYNPLHYIPYRTYNRIVKDQRQAGHRTRSSDSSLELDNSESKSGSKRHAPSTRNRQLQDLNYLEVVNSPDCSIEGGVLRRMEYWLDQRLQESYSLNIRFNK